MKCEDVVHINYVTRKYVTFYDKDWSVKMQYNYVGYNSFRL